MNSADAHQPFLDAILADPDDAVPYGIYADWLTEHGDPLGEFIHVQLHLEDESLAGVDRMRLKSRESKLVMSHESQWLGPLYAPLVKSKQGTVGDQQVTYRHGYAKGFLEFVHAPVLLPEFAAALRLSPHAEFLRRLSLEEIPAASQIPPFPIPTPDEAFERPGLKELADARFPNLRQFEIRSQAPWAMAYGLEKVLAGTPRLEQLHLEVREVNSPALFGLELPYLRELTLNYIDSYDLTTLAANPSLGKLERICFYPHWGWSRDGLSLAGFQAICRSKWLTSLTDLSLYHADLGDAGISELTQSPLLKQLKRLDLSYGEITDTGAQTLAEAIARMDPKNLQQLVLDCNQLTNAGIDALASTGAEIRAESRYSDDEDDYWDFADWDME